MDDSKSLCDFKRILVKTGKSSYTDKILIRCSQTGDVAGCKIYGNKSNLDEVLIKLTKKCQCKKIIM